MKRKYKHLELELKEYGPKGDKYSAMMIIRGEHGNTVGIFIEPYLDRVYINTTNKKTLDIKYMDDDEMGVVIIEGFKRSEQQ